MDINTTDRLPSLYGSEITHKHCIGYCCYHRCYVTATQIKTKECLRKQCRALERYEHEFWRQRELKKINKKKSREVY